MVMYPSPQYFLACDLLTKAYLISLGKPHLPPITTWKSTIVETFITTIVTLLIIPYGLTICLLAIFKVIEAGLLIFNLKYLIVKIVITLTPAFPSTNIPCKIDPLH